MNPIPNHSTPVIMLSSGHHGALGIARSLGRLGVPVYSVDSNWWEPSFTSRYCRGRLLLDVGKEPPDVAIARLQELARKAGGCPLLIPTTDQNCSWVAENAAALHESFCFPVQQAGLVHTLCDKSRMQELARKYGVPTAQSLLPHSAEEVERFAAHAEFPVMVKETAGGRLRERAGGSKFLVKTARELTDLYARVGDPEHPNLIIQEFIPGEDWMFDGYFDAGSHCLFGVTARKIRRFPPGTGVTSLGICAANETVFRTTTDFMRAIGYRGILDIGYRRDQRDGRYKVLDVNPRIGCTFRLFAGVNGLDVARALYLDMTGQAVPADAAADGRKWLVEDFDLLSSLRSWRDGVLTAAEWMRSFTGIEETACFAFDDPLPSLMMAVADGCELYRWFRGRASVRQPRTVAPALPLTSNRRY
jgi:predicted ATP-grasp superfamily ATP-dependent carboligase